MWKVETVQTDGVDVSVMKSVSEGMVPVAVPFHLQMRPGSLVTRVACSSVKTVIAFNFDVRSQESTLEGEATFDVLPNSEPNAMLASWCWGGQDGRDVPGQCWHEVAYKLDCRVLKGKASVHVACTVKDDGLLDLKLDPRDDD